jgi:predicted NBD/HSP70 family sugar kinase
MVFAVNAVIVFMDISRFAKLALALRRRPWIGLSAAAGAAGMIAISKPFPFVGFLLLCRFSRRRSQRVGPPCAAQC